MKSLKILFMIVGFSTVIVASDGSSSSYWNQSKDSITSSMNFIGSYFTKKQPVENGYIQRSISALKSCGSNSLTFIENHPKSIGSVVVVGIVIATLAAMKYNQDGYLFYESQLADQESQPVA